MMHHIKSIIDVHALLNRPKNIILNIARAVKKPDEVFDDARIHLI